MLKFVEKYKIVDLHQQSGLVALSSFIDRIIKYTEDLAYAIGVFLDLFQAFDIINNDTFLYENLSSRNSMSSSAMV